MCELFGLSSPDKIRCNELLKTFFSHGNEHPHGWGMAFFYGNSSVGNSVSVEKQAKSSVKSSYLKDRLRSDIEVSHMLAHIRLATKGSIEYNNTHPFVMRDNTGRALTFEHNGTIFESGVLTSYIHRQEGNTDSERILCYLIDRLNEKIDANGGIITDNERFNIVNDLVQKISPENKLNLIISDEENMYVHTNYKKSLYICKKGASVIISTRPLDYDRWEPLPLNTLKVFRNGEVVYTGTTHEHEFFDSEEKMRYLFLDFAQI